MVVAIVGVVALIAVPRFAEASSRYRCELAADQLAALLREAAASARASAGAHRVLIDTDAERVAIVRDADGAVIAELDFAVGPLDADIVSASFIPVTPAWLSFDASGKSEQLAIIMVEAGGLVRSVSLYAGTSSPTIGPQQDVDDYGNAQLAGQASYNDLAPTTSIASFVDGTPTARSRKSP